VQPYWRLPSSAETFGHVGVFLLNARRMEATPVDIINPAVDDYLLQGNAVVAMRQMNEIIVGDSRVESVMLPVRDGVTLARKR
jgi:hypothetical protein